MSRTILHKQTGPDPMPLSPTEYNRRKAAIDVEWPAATYPSMNAGLRSELDAQRGGQPKITEAEYDALPLSAQAEYLAAQPDKSNAGLFAPDPERDAATARAEQEALANVEQDYRDKALRKVVKAARGMQERDIQQAITNGEDGRTARWRYSRLDAYLPSLAPGETQVERQGRVKDLEARDKQAVKDWYKTGSDDSNDGTDE